MLLLLFYYITFPEKEKENRRLGERKRVRSSGFEVQAPQIFEIITRPAGTLFKEEGKAESLTLNPEPLTPLSLLTIPKICYNKEKIFLAKDYMMKKIIFFLLLLGAAVYGGISLGNSVTRPDSHLPVTAKAVSSSSPAASSDEGILHEAVHMVTTLISGLSSDETKEGAVEITPPKETGSSISQAEELTTLQEKFYTLSHFKDAVEGRVNRVGFVPIEKVPPLLKKAIIATEDRRFYEHGAVDVIGIGRALFTNYIAGHTMEGGSTISQQVVKNMFLSSERTMTRKAEELAFAVQLERTYSKDEILELYLNTIYFGHGAYGIRDAAKTYFNKSVQDLTLSECAMLSGLPQAPSAYDPIDHPQEGKKRMITVLALMAEQGIISAPEAAKAAAGALLE